MLLSNYPDDSQTVVCSHVSKRQKDPLLVIFEDDGVVVSCGCEFDEADVVAFGKLKEQISDLMQCETLGNGKYYARTEKGTPWQIGSFDAD